MNKLMISRERKEYLNSIKKKKYLVLLTQILILIGFLAIWELMANKGIIDSFITSQPSRIFNTFLNLGSNNLLYHVGVTTYETILGIKEKMKTEGIDLVEFNEFAQTVVELGNSSQTYMSAKKLSQHTELGKDRFALATDMRDLAQENFAIKEAAPEVKKPEVVKAPEQIMML